MFQPTIITFANKAYIPVVLNWLRAIDRLNLNATVRVVALDEATRDALPPERVLFRPLKVTDLGALWLFRVKILRELLVECEGLVHSDADAVWMRDPLPAIQACNSDLVFSQGTVWPPDIHARHRIVVCCGFFYLRRTDSVLELLDELESRVEIDQDDQKSFNKLLDGRGVQWEIAEPYSIAFRDTDFIASREVIRGCWAAPPSVAILPHHQFPRLIERISAEVIVAHPLSPKDCAAKIQHLSLLGLWR